MPNTDPRVDEYISRSAEFAKPILNHLRKVIFKACPEVKEVMKWSFPNYEYAGSILCSVAAFKQHCSFGFWLATLMSDPDKLLTTDVEKTAMGHFGQLKNIKDLPSDKVLVKYIREAMLLTDQGFKREKKVTSDEKKEIEIPTYFSEVLQQHLKAYEVFKNFSPSHRKEYLEWITEAKTEATRNSRIAKTIVMLEEGKQRHWKYMK